MERDANSSSVRRLVDENLPGIALVVGENRRGYAQTRRRQEHVLYETHAGSMHESRQMDCSLVGGHTIEGPNLTVGYTVLADQGTPKKSA